MGNLFYYLTSLTLYFCFHSGPTCPPSTPGVHQGRTKNRNMWTQWWYLTMYTKTQRSPMAPTSSTWRQGRNSSSNPSHICTPSEPFTRRTTTGLPVTRPVADPVLWGTDRPREFFSVSCWSSCWLVQWLRLSLWLCWVSLISHVVNFLMKNWIYRPPPKEKPPKINKIKLNKMTPLPINQTQNIKR